MCEVKQSAANIDISNQFCNLSETIAMLLLIRRGKPYVLLGDGRPIFLRMAEQTTLCLRTAGHGKTFAGPDHSRTLGKRCSHLGSTSAVRPAPFQAGLETRTASEARRRGQHNLRLG